MSDSPTYAPAVQEIQGPPAVQGIQAVRVNRALSQQLESLRSAGVMQLPRHKIPCLDELPAPAAEPPTGPEATPHAPPARGAGDSHEPKPGGHAPRSATATLEGLHAEVAQCVQCRELAETRTQTVFGVGDPQARLCILGEAPGADEDRLGEPFVGRAGQLLDKILAACQLRRDEVYILNVLKCRPPGNRNPSPQEAAHCRPFLDRQLQLIRPDFICCMGAVAAQNLLSTTTSIGHLRGKVHNYQGVRVVCTYHPAYLLRTPAAKAKTWKDMKLLMREMGVDLG